MSEEDDVRQEDVFGLPKLSTNAEVGISFTLFVLGNLLVFSVLYATNTLVAPSALGLMMIAVSYFFMIEAVRELEEKDHFLSEKLMKD
jgi:hypothetical protein